MPAGVASPSDPLALVLHIGMGKTGTSSIQVFLNRNRDTLAALGYLYPRSPGLKRHTRLGLFIRPDDDLLRHRNWPRQNAADPVAFRKSFRRRLFKEIDSSGLSHVVLSDEGLYIASDPALRRLRRFTDRIARNVRILVYLRRQDDQLISRYQQEVKVGEVQRLDQWARRGFERIYDYRARLRTHARLLEPTQLVVRRFETPSFVDGSLYQDFLDAAGIAARAMDLEQVAIRNVSLDAESVECLRLLNLYRVEHEGAIPRMIDNRELTSKLVHGSTGPSLTMPNSFLDEFMDGWKASNSAVARDFLGMTEGPLFQLPRKSRNTTTEQRLDPARLDYFMRLLELPEQVHEPLRRLAEREARAPAPR